MILYVHEARVQKMSSLYHKYGPAGNDDKQFRDFVITSLCIESDLEQELAYQAGRDLKSLLLSPGYAGKGRL